MEDIILIAAALGLVLLWDRALPLKPIRDWIVVRLHRIYEWIMRQGDQRPQVDWVDWLTDKLHECVAYPFWLLKNLLNCSECLCPYVAFGLTMGLGRGWICSLLLAAAAYAGWVYLFGKHHDA